MYQFFCSLLFGVIFLPLLALGEATKQTPFARVQGMALSADSLDRDSEIDSIDLIGNVQVIYKQQHLWTDRAKINFRARTIDAIGSVVLTNQTATIRADRMTFDYESQTGLIYNGSVEAGSVYLEGQILQKIDDQTFLASSSLYTSCNNCPSTFSFTGQTIRAELGGYAFIKNATMRIGPVPVFWMPYLAVPLKSDRQTGLLSPQFELSEQGGLAVEQALYKVISKSQDATLKLKYYDLRGLKVNTEYRYQLTERSGGELYVGSIQDRVFANSDRVKAFQKSSSDENAISRWFVNYQHFYELPEDFVSRLNVRNTSDMQYPQDFSTELDMSQGEPSLESRVSLTKRSNDQLVTLDASYYKNLLQRDPLASTRESTQRIPEVSFYQKDIALWGTSWLGQLNFDFTQFARLGYAYDDIELDSNGKKKIKTLSSSNPICQTQQWQESKDCRRFADGVFDPTIDLIRAGQRLDFEPKVYRTFQLGPLDFTPNLSYRETQYTFPIEGYSSNIRRSVRAGLSTRTSFSRVYGDLELIQGSRIKHEMIPQISFTTVPWLEHPAHPFFGNTDINDTPFIGQENLSNSDLNGIYGLQFDYRDRIFDRKLVTLDYTQKLVRKTWLDGQPNYQQFLTWRLSQSYDAYQAERRGAFSQPFSRLLSEIQADFSKISVGQSTSYFPYAQVSNTNSRVTLTDNQGHFFETRHSITYNITPTATEVKSSDRKEDISFSVYRSTRDIDAVAKLTYDLSTGDRNSLKAWGYAFRYKAPGNCWDIDFVQFQIVRGDTQSKLLFNFKFDGQSTNTVKETFGKNVPNF